MPSWTVVARAKRAADWLLRMVALVSAQGRLTTRSKTTLRERRSHARFTANVRRAKVDDRQLAEAYYPAWLKVLSYVGIPALTGIGLWLVSRPLWEQGITPLQYGVGFAFGVAVLYQCTIGWLVLKYINVRIIAFNDRLLIQSNGREQTVLWEELAPAKEYSFATATRLSLKTGETIVYAFDNMSDLHVIKSVLKDEHEQAVAT
jgi:hypothetical protein